MKIVESNLPTMVDDMGGLYTHASDAYRDGKRAGRDDFFRAVISALQTISISQEKMPPSDDLATRGFHIAQECCKAVVELKGTFDKERRTL